MNNPHLVAVWNPLYTGGVDDVEQHFTMLLDWKQKAKEGKAGEDDVYVWWGKVKSPNRQQPLRNAEQIRQLAESLDRDDAPETHLYVTDYRSLYVGELLGIEEGDLPGAERSHVPPYYATRTLTCDFWFMVADFRRLVSDDLPAVAEELHKLRNVNYHDKPVSLYGGMVDLPLIVTREDDTQFFGAERDHTVGENRLWVQYDQESGASHASIQRDLRENVIGEKAWTALGQSARTCLAQGERLFRDHRNEPAYDFSDVIINFAKALESQTNSVLRAAAARLPVGIRTRNLDGRSVDLANARTLGLGELASLVGKDRDLSTALAAALSNGQWFAFQLPAILDAFRGVRNPGAHTGRVDRETATLWRNQILGVGCTGHMVELAHTTLKR